MMSTLPRGLKTTTPEEVFVPFSPPRILEDNKFKEANKIINFQLPYSIELVVFEDDPNEGNTPTEDPAAKPPKN